MKILFIHSHKFRKINSRIFSLGGLSEEVLNRYINKDDEITVISRIVNEERSKSNYSEIKDSRIKIKNIYDIKLKGLKKEIRESEVVIIRLPCLIGNIAIKFAKKYNKKYLIEVVGCGWDAYWNHGILGKILAPISYFSMRKNVKSASNVLYVSNNFLQNRYPTKGKTIACSDVIINEVEDNILKNRLSKIDKFNNKNIILGTIGAVNVKYKGQEYIIKAIKSLKENGYKVRYELVGSGNSEYLKKIAKKYNVLEEVKFIGSLEHNQIFTWLDNIDIYVQPSKLEGLCRAVIEALSRACPCILSDAGGNVELIDNKYIFKKKNILDFIDKLNKLNKQEMKKQAINNFNKAKEFSDKKLNEKREEFYSDFLVGDEK